MSNIFQIATSDQSQYYLGYIFGSVGTVLTPGGTGVTTIGILSVLFKFFNTSVLTLGAFLVIYTTVVGLLATAHEGEFMGKKWSGLWVPIRTVMGIALLFPVSSGYSAIQIIMMWIIMQSIGMADVLWTTGLVYVAKAGSPTASISVTPSPGLTNNLTTVLQALVCQASARAVPDVMTSYPGVPAYADANIYYSPTTNSNTPGAANYYYCADSNYSGSAFCQISSDDAMFNIIPSTTNTGSAAPQASTSSGTVTYNFGPWTSGSPGACGHITYPDPAVTCASNPSSLQCVSQKAQQAALQSIIKTVFGPIAKKLVSADHDYIGFYDNAVPFAQVPSPPMWIQDYCSAPAQSYLPQDCCYSMAPPPIPLLSGGQLPNMLCKYASSFQPDYVPGTNPPISDTTNTSSGAMNMYNTYSLVPYINSLGIASASSASGSSPANVDFIKAAADQYTKTIADAVNAFLLAPASSTTLTDWLANAQNTGWILAGGYYYKLSNNDNNNNSQANPAFTIVAGDPRVPSNGSAMANYRNNYSATGALLNNIASQNQDQGGIAASLPSQLAGIGSVSSSMSNSLLASFMASMTTNSGSGGITSVLTTPLQSVTHFGYILMILAQLSYAVIVALVFVLIVTGKINFIALGFGLTEDPLGSGFQALLTMLMPLIAALIGAIYGLGALLGIYVPLIPYIIFTMGAIGWFIAVLEAMVAAPLIALGILSPGGQHEILGRAEHALMMVLNLFLRPALMIFGMFASMLLTGVVVTMINSGFLAVVQSIMSNPGLFEQILFISAYTTLIVTALNKAFSVIYVIPERITTWIGGQAVSYGEHEALGQVKQGVESAASGASGAARSSASGLEQAGGAEQKARAERKTPGPTLTPKK